MNSPTNGADEARDIDQPVAPPTGQAQMQRDVMSFLLLGGFFAVMAILVLIGTFWTLGRPHAMVVNLVSGLMLLAVGVGMLAFGVRLHRRGGGRAKSP